MKFRKKPVVIDAVQWDEDARTLDTLPGLRSIVLSHEGSIYLPCLCQNLRIKTPEGDLHVSRGDWIIRGVKGEYYPCKPDIFAATYEPTDAPDESARLREEVERLTNALASARAEEQECHTCHHVVPCADCGNPEWCGLFPNHNVTPFQLGFSCGKWVPRAIADTAETPGGGK